ARGRRRRLRMGRRSAGEGHRAARQARALRRARVDGRRSHGGRRTRPHRRLVRLRALPRARRSRRDARAGPRMTTQLPWYIARASGLVSWSMLALATLWGLALSTKVLGPRPRPNWILDIHRMLGGLALIFTGVHIAALLVDSYVGFGVADVLVPFAAKWHPVAVAWGVVGLYLLLAVELTSLARAH